MSTKTKFTATFLSGPPLVCESVRAFTHAWQVTGTWGGKTTTVRGMASSAKLAEKAAAKFTALSSGWVGPVVEIVSVTS